jgi:hypothetical protein
MTPTKNAFGFLGSPSKSTRQKMYFTFNGLTALPVGFHQTKSAKTAALPIIFCTETLK